MYNEFLGKIFEFKLDTDTDESMPYEEYNNALCEKEPNVVL